jgi:outer membrane protein OmpA-like peptidoglycan-associated protein
MFRPEVESNKRCAAVLAGALIFAGLGSLSAARAFPTRSAPVDDAAGYAEDTAAPDDDAGRYGGDGDRSYGGGAYGESTYGPEPRAQELYLDGLEKLNGGHRDWAQTTFESVIARFPDSAAARLARHRLGDLYRGTPAETAAAPATAPITTATVAPVVARTAAATPAVAQPPAAPGSGPVWDQELRRNAPIQAKLRGEAGDRIFFSSGSAELGTRARMALAAQAQWLVRWREFEAAVEGHADEPGTEEDNLTLSRLRAEAVRQRLIEEGVEASRVSIVAAGRTQRVATCASPDCTSQNRRAVTLVFASGTRARLGLAGPATADASTDRPAELSPTRTVGVPPVLQPVEPQQVGVTR